MYEQGEKTSDEKDSDSSNVQNGSWLSSSFFLIHLVPIFALKEEADLTLDSTSRPRKRKGLSDAPGITLELDSLLRYTKQMPSPFRLGK